jgi:hypothetical protein
MTIPLPILRKLLEPYINYRKYRFLYKLYNCTNSPLAAVFPDGVIYNVPLSGKLFETLRASTSDTLEPLFQWVSQSNPDFLRSIMNSKHSLFQDLVYFIEGKPILNTMALLKNINEDKESILILIGTNVYSDLYMLYY